MGFIVKLRTGKPTPNLLWHAQDTASEEGIGS